MILDVNFKSFVNGLNVDELKEVYRLINDRRNFLDEYEVSEDLVQMVISGKKIEAIKALRNKEGFSLQDSKAIIDHLVDILRLDGRMR